MGRVPPMTQPMAQPTGLAYVLCTANGTPRETFHGKLYLLYGAAHDTSGKICTTCGTAHDTACCAARGIARGSDHTP